MLVIKMNLELGLSQGLRLSLLNVSAEQVLPKLSETQVLHGHLPVRLQAISFALAHLQN